VHLLNKDKSKNVFSLLTLYLLSQTDHINNQQQQIFTRIISQPKISRLGQYLHY